MKSYSHSSKKKPGFPLKDCGNDVVGVASEIVSNTFLNETTNHFRILF